MFTVHKNTEVCVLGTNSGLIRFCAQACTRSNQPTSCVNVSAEITLRRIIRRCSYRTISHRCSSSSSQHAQCCRAQLSAMLMTLKYFSCKIPASVLPSLTEDRERNAAFLLAHLQLYLYMCCLSVF